MVAASVRGSATCTEWAVTSEISGVSPPSFRGLRVCASLPYQTPVWVGLGGTLLGAASRASWHINGKNKHENGSRSKNIKKCLRRFLPY